MIIGSKHIKQRNNFILLLHEKTNTQFQSQIRELMILLLY